MVRSAALKRAKMEGCPESSKQSPSCDMTSPIPDPPHISPSLEDLSPDTRITHSQALKIKRRKLISAIWTEAIPIYRDGKLMEGRCMHCRQVFAAARDKGTSHLKRHLKVCEAKIAMNEMVDKMGHPEGVDPNWKFDHVVARQKLVKLIVVNEMPFSFVEYKPFREFAAALNPWFEKVSRTTIKKECMAVFNDHGNKLKECFERSDARISLTGDMWTPNQKLGYFCMTCHIISSEWVLHKRIIRFSMLETPRNSWNMFNVVLKTIQEWNLEDKLFSFTLDNASVNTAMVNLLRDNLKNKGFLPIEGKLLHFRCRTHVLNIISQDGLREIKPVVNNIRKSAKFVKSSQGRIEKFLEIIMQEELTGKYKSRSVDVTTRWNSNYLMLEAATPLRNTFYSLENRIRIIHLPLRPLNGKLLKLYASCWRFTTQQQ
uniref:Uncharacterized protein n=1 Tax=Avena sativa TaxID=4498 RepID=A0ACD5YT64_AVESA